MVAAVDSGLVDRGRGGIGEEDQLVGVIYPRAVEVAFDEGLAGWDDLAIVNLQVALAGIVEADQAGLTEREGEIVSLLDDLLDGDATPLHILVIVESMHLSGCGLARCFAERKWLVP